MGLIRPGTCCDVHDSTVEAAELRRYVVRFDREFLDVVDNREKHDLSRFGLQG